MRRAPSLPLDGRKVPFRSGGVTKPKEGVRCVCSGVWNLSKICNFPLHFLREISYSIHCINFQVLLARHSGC